MGIKSDENPFYVIILRFAEFPQMFVPLRIVSTVSALCCPQGAFLRPHTGCLCGPNAQRSSQVGWLPWLLPTALRRTEGALSLQRPGTRPVWSSRGGRLPGLLALLLSALSLRALHPLISEF